MHKYQIKEKYIHSMWVMNSNVRETKHVKSGLVDFS